TLSPDARQVVVAGPGVRLYDLETGQEVRHFEGHPSEAGRAALSPDGRWLLTGGFDGGVRLWDFQAAQLALVLGHHDNFVLGVAFTPDGRLATSAGGGERSDGKFLPGTDHAIRLWDVSALSAAPAPPPKSAVKGWVAAAGLLWLVLALSGFGVWCYVRLGRRAATATAPAPVPEPPARADSAPAPLAVQCAGCGQKLKARAELAGKKVKCPKCGQAVFVPAIQAG